MKAYKRRNFFIDRQFQTKYILLVIFMLLMYTIMLVGMLFIPQLLPFMFKSSLNEQIKAAEILLIYHKHVWPAVFIVIPMFAFFSIFITHKVAGPVYRLKTRLKQMAEGEITSRVKLREGDDLKDLADSVNILAEELEAFVAALKSDYGVLAASISQIEEQLAAGNINKATGEELLTRLQAGRQNIAETLAHFRVMNPAENQ